MCTRKEGKELCMCVNVCVRAGERTGNAVWTSASGSWTASARLAQLFASSYG